MLDRRQDIVVIGRLTEKMQTALIVEHNSPIYTLKDIKNAHIAYQGTTDALIKVFRLAAHLSPQDAQGVVFKTGFSKMFAPYQDPPIAGILAPVPITVATLHQDNIQTRVIPLTGVPDMDDVVMVVKKTSSYPAIFKDFLKTLGEVQRWIKTNPKDAMQAVQDGERPITNPLFLSALPETIPYLAQYPDRLSKKQYHTVGAFLKTAGVVHLPFDDTSMVLLHIDHP
jgi:ABC-type nitrate/sulfonate/bicarbonate transport system substrate-binding protein